MIPTRYQDFYGDETRWFIGTVVDLLDPKELGRIRVRIMGIHSDNLQDIPDNTLPWAQTIMPITEGGVNGLGINTGIQIGARVFGMFLDGTNSQLPLVFGSLPKYENEDGSVTTTSKLATGTSELEKSLSVAGAPGDPYGAEYPYNSVHATRSGHVIEIDDTDGAERIHIRHKSGSFIEFHPDGAIVIKGNGVYIDGGVAVNVKATNTVQEYSTGDVTMSNGEVTIGTGEITVSGITHTKHRHTDTPGLAAGTTSGPKG